MNITTKFQIGDTAFRLHHNKVQEVEIARFHINVKSAGFIAGERAKPIVEICYTLKDTSNETNDRDNYEYEGTLFATKAELLASL
jgi:hypothetical protein